MAWILQDFGIGVGSSSSSSSHSFVEGTVVWGNIEEILGAPLMLPMGEDFIFGDPIGVEEDFARQFTGNWELENITIDGEGNSEKLVLGQPGYAISEPWKTGAGQFHLFKNKYGEGIRPDLPEMDYRTAETYPDLLNAEWTSLGNFVNVTSLGFVQIRVVIGASVSSSSSSRSSSSRSSSSSSSCRSSSSSSSSCRSSSSSSLSSSSSSSCLSSSSSCRSSSSSSSTSSPLTAENFTLTPWEYYQVAGKTTLTANQIQATNLTSPDFFMLRANLDHADLSVLGDFVCNLDITLTTFVDNSTTDSRCLILSFLGTNPGTAIYLKIYNSGSNYRFGLGTSQAGTVTSYYDYSSLPLTRYLTITRVLNTTTINIFTDSQRTVLETSLSATDGTSYGTGHVYPPWIYWMANSTNVASFTISNMRFLSYYPSSPAPPPSTSYRGGVSNDDGYGINGLTTDEYSIRLYALDVGGSGTESDLYVRFPNIAIPQGATITSAKLYLYSHYSTIANLTTTIYAEDVDNAVAPTSILDLQTKVLTSASILWTIGGASTGYTDTPYWTSTPDISTVIQEVVNRAGWSSGSSIQIIIKSTQYEVSSIAIQKAFVSHDFGWARPLFKPGLYITYTI